MLPPTSPPPPTHSPPPPPTHPPPPPTLPAEDMQMSTSPYGAAAARATPAAPSGRELSRPAGGEGYDDVWVTVFGFGPSDLPLVIREFSKAGDIVQVRALSGGWRAGWHGTVWWGPASLRVTGWAGSLWTHTAWRVQQRAGVERLCQGQGQGLCRRFRSQHCAAPLLPRTCCCSLARLARRRRSTGCTCSTRWVRWEQVAVGQQGRCSCLRPPSQVEAEVRQWSGQVLHTLMSCTPSCLAHPHVLHTLMSCTPSCLAHPHVLHTLMSCTPSCLAHPHVLHTLMSCTPSCLAHPHVLHTLMSCTPSCLAHPHVLHTLMSCSPRQASRRIAPPFIPAAAEQARRAARPAAQQRPAVGLVHGGRQAPGRSAPGGGGQGGQRRRRRALLCPGLPQTAAAAALHAGGAQRRSGGAAGQQGHGAAPQRVRAGLLSCGRPPPLLGRRPVSFRHT